MNFKSLKSKKVIPILILISIIIIFILIGIIYSKFAYKKEEISTKPISTEELVEEELEEDYMDINQLENSQENVQNENTNNETKDNQSTKPKQNTNTNTNNNKTSYYIKVNYGAQVVTIYKKDADGNYTVPVKAMVCSTGNATPKSGVYSIPARWEWLRLQGYVWGHYSTQIKGNILFHSVPYLKKGDPASLEYWEYDKLGTYASAGCVRLTVQDAKWIYNNCAKGTQVEFYSSSNPGPLGKPSAKKISSYPDNLRNWDPTDSNENNPWKTYKESNKTNTSTSTNKENTTVQNNTTNNTNTVVQNNINNNTIKNEIKNNSQNTIIKNEIVNKENENKVDKNTNTIKEKQ